MKKIKEMLIVFMFIISVSAVAAPQGHPLSDIWDNSYPFTFGELLIASGGISTTTITANGAVNAGNIVVPPIGDIKVGGIKLSSATLDMDTGKITNLGVPTVDTDAATKKYVDDEINTNTPGIIWAKNGNDIFYTAGFVAIGTNVPTAMLEVKSIVGKMGIVLDTSSQTSDWNYGMIVKATRDNTKAFAVTGVTDKFVVYGNGKIVFPANKVYISESIGCEYTDHSCAPTRDLGKHSFCALGEYHHDGSHSAWCSVVYDEANDKWILKAGKDNPVDGGVSCKAYCI